MSRNFQFRKSVPMWCVQHGTKKRIIVCMCKGLIQVRDVFVAIWLLVQQHKLGGTHAWLLHTRSTCSVRYSNLLPTRKGKLVISMSCVLSTFLKVGSKLVLHIFTSSSCFLSLSCTVTLSGSSGSYSVHALLYLPFPIFPSSRRSTSWQQKVYYEGRCQRWYNAVGFEVHQQSLSIITALLRPFEAYLNHWNLSWIHSSSMGFATAASCA